MTMTTDMRQCTPLQTDSEISCDQVAWLKDILARYDQVIRMGYPRVSRLVEVAKMAAILEIMEVLRFRFADKLAALNAISDFPELLVLIKDTSTQEQK